MFLKPVAAVLNEKPCVGGENRGLLIRDSTQGGMVGVCVCVCEGQGGGVLCLCVCLRPVVLQENYVLTEFSISQTTKSPNVPCMFLKSLIFLSCVLLKQTHTRIQTLGCGRMEKPSFHMFVCFKGEVRRGYFCTHHCFSSGHLQYSEVWH